MKVDNLFLLYENSGKFFNSYNDAYYNSLKPMMLKQIYYVFTPTMQKFKRVCEIEKCCRDYFKNHTDCDYFDIFRNVGTKQLNIFEEI